MFDLACKPRGIKLLNAEAFWEQGYFGQNIKVAVIDSGCDINHICLKDRIIDTKNLTNDKNITDRHHHHGTHISGIIASNGIDGGLVGVAPKCELVIIKILNRDGLCADNSLISAILYAMKMKVDIINMSISGMKDSHLLHKVIRDAYNEGIMLVASSGNQGDKRMLDRVSYPGAYKQVINVSACNFEGRVLHFSNPSEYIDLTCYGANITSCLIDNRYSKMSGTSQAAAHVTGALALLKCYFIDTQKRVPTNKELYDLLISMTTKTEGVNDHMQGNGVLRLSL